MFTKCGSMTCICVLLLVTVAANADDFANEPNSVLLERSAHSLWSGVKGHWRGITGDDNGNDQRSKRKVRTTLIQNLARANQNFSVSMYHLLKINNPNLVFSPHSVHTALTMTYMGAKTLTAKEMQQVLGLMELKKLKAHQTYSTLIQSLQQPSDVTLLLANAVFTNPRFPIKIEFTTGLSKFYQAGFDRFHFDAPGGPETPINQWVSKMTKGKISNILKSGSVTEQTVLVILNAVYFKGKWLNTFNVTLTKEEDFDVTKDNKVKVPMMTRVGRYNFTSNRGLKANILELPYADTRYSMFIILPTERNGLDTVEERVTSASLTSALDSLIAIKLKVFLPKFKVESELNLKETLTQMGMVKAFSEKYAKFSGISSHPGLYISDVYHKAVIEVTEEGTEAAATTSVVISSRLAVPVFIADHPFMYVIRDNVNRVILFLGKYSGQK